MKFVYGDIRKESGFSDESFDVVTACFSVPAKISLFEGYNESIMKETYRVLRDDGRSAFFTGCSEISKIYFSEKEYKVLLGKAGYKHMQIKSINGLYTIVSARK